MAKFRFKISTCFRKDPFDITAISYKISKNRLTLNLTTKKIVVYTLNKIDMFEMEVLDD